MAAFVKIIVWIKSLSHQVGHQISSSIIRPSGRIRPIWLFLLRCYLFIYFFLYIFFIYLFFFIYFYLFIYLFLLTCLLFLKEYCKLRFFLKQDFFKREYMRIHLSETGKWSENFSSINISFCLWYNNKQSSQKVFQKGYRILNVSIIFEHLH